MSLYTKAMIDPVYQELYLMLMSVAKQRDGAFLLWMYVFYVS